MTALGTAAQQLRDHMSDISEHVYAAGWMADCEWHLWDALTVWRTGDPAVWAFADITSWMPRLHELQQRCGGWIWWLDYPGARGGAQFVPEDRWRRLYEERERAQRHIANEQLDIRIRL